MLYFKLPFRAELVVLPEFIIGQLKVNNNITPLGFFCLHFLICTSANLQIIFPSGFFLPSGFQLNRQSKKDNDFCMRLFRSKNINVGNGNPVIIGRVVMTEGNVYCLTGKIADINTA